MDIDVTKFEDAIVREAADQILSAEGGETHSRLLSKVNDEVKRRIDVIFAERAEALIDEALTAAVQDGFDREYQKVDQWGQREGEKTTVRRELSRLIGNYWNEKVDKNGRPDKGYNATTRAEWLMTKICAESFSDQMKAAAVNVTAELKDGLRAQLAKHVDGLLDSLFRVKSIQDQGKAGKPW